MPRPGEPDMVLLTILEPTARERTAAESHGTAARESPDSSCDQDEPIKNDTARVYRDEGVQRAAGRNYGLPVAPEGYRSIDDRTLAIRPVQDDYLPAASEALMASWIIVAA